VIQAFPQPSAPDHIGQLYQLFILIGQLLLLVSFLTNVITYRAYRGGHPLANLFFIMSSSLLLASLLVVIFTHGFGVFLTQGAVFLLFSVVLIWAVGWSAIKFNLFLLSFFFSPLLMLLLYFSLDVNRLLPQVGVTIDQLMIVHLTIIILSFAFLGLSFSLALAYLVVDAVIRRKISLSLTTNLPSLETIDMLTYITVAVGFGLFTVGIFFGTLLNVWRYHAFWTWSFKESFALITWLVYAAYLHTRLIVGWQGRRVRFLLIAGFALVLFTFLAVMHFKPGGFPTNGI
jgi:ABC-type transport system involved in cytochrome c biogenesis permease subunit